MKRVLFWVLGFIVMLGAALVLVSSRIDTRFVADKIASVSAETTGKTLFFEDGLQISFFPLGMSFGRARWGEAESREGISFSLKGGLVSLELLPLFRGKIVVDEVRLDEPVVQIVFPSAMSARQIENGRQESIVTREALSEAFPLELKLLRIQQGRLLLSDGMSRMELRDIDLSIKNLRRQEEAGIQCRFDLAFSPEGRKDTLVGRFDAVALLRYYAPHLTFRQMALSYTPKAGQLLEAASPMMLECEGAFDLQNLGLRLASADLSTPQARLHLKGQGNLRSEAFSGKISFQGSLRKLAALGSVSLKAAASDRLSYDSDLEWSSNGLHLRQISMQLGAIPIKGDISLELGAPPVLSAAIQTGVITLDDYLPMSSEKGLVPSSEEPQKSRSAIDTAAMPALDVQAAFGGIKYGRSLVRDVNFVLKGKYGYYILQDLTGTLSHGGAFTVSGTGDLATDNYAIKVRASEVLLGPLFEALGWSRSLEGKADIDADLRTHGRDIAVMQAKLKGSGLLEIRNLQIKPLSTLFHSIPLPMGRETVMPDRFEVMRAPFSIDNGEMLILPFSARAKGLDALGQGRISLPRAHLDAKVRVDTMGISIPVVAEGSFDDIRFGVDPRFALDLANKVPGVLPDAGQGTKHRAGPGEALKKGLQDPAALIRSLLGQ